MQFKPPEKIPESVSPELRVNCARFVASLHGTSDGVYAALITNHHGSKTNTVSEWRVILSAYKTRAVERPISARVKASR